MLAAIPQTVPFRSRRPPAPRRRPGWPALLLAAAVLFGCAPKIDPGPVPVSRAARPVEVLVQPNSDSLVHFVAVINAGSAFDPPGSEGLAHLTAHSAVRSPDPASPGSDPPGHFNADVDRDQVELWLECPADLQRACARRFVHALTSPPDEAHVQELREQVRQQTRDLLEDPAEIGRAALTALVFEAHPYAHPPKGRSSVQPLLRAAQVRAFQARHWVRESVHVGVRGPVEADLAAWLERELEALPPDMAPDRALMQPVPATASTLAVVEATAADQEVTLHFGWPIRSTGPNRPALALEAAVLATPDDQGRLPEALQRVGLSTRISVDLPGLLCDQRGTFREQPLLAIHLGPLPPDRAAEALRIATAEFRRLEAEPPSEAEKARAAEHLRRQQARLARDPVRALTCELASRAAGLPDPAIDAEGMAHSDPAGLVDPARARIVAVGGPFMALTRHLLEDELSPLVHSSPGPGAALIGGPSRDAPEPDLDSLHLDGVWTLQAEDIFR